ncbi:MAG: hypothetical protein IPK93_03930 [Solirubrobacterales bacterium]|nr:hypothetical protein [Solirubrobacterales bacterium]
MRLSEHRPNHRLTQVTLLLLALALTAVGIAGFSSPAKAGPVSLKFDNGRINLGIFKDPILPATSAFPSDDLPVPQRTDITLNGTETNGELSFPAALNTGLQFPYMNVPHPLEDLKIPLTFRLQEPGLTGTYDAATGETHINGKLDVIVVTGTGTSFPVPDGLVDVGVPPLGLLARCRLPGIELNLSTETKAPMTAQRFTGGFGVNGALTGTFDQAPEAVSENGGDCFLVSAVTAGKGAFWLSNGIEKPVPQPPVVQTCENNSDLCKAAITGLTLTRKKKKVKAGKKTKLTLAVTNTGDADAFGVTVGLSSSNKRVKLPKTLDVDVPAGQTTTETIKVKAKRRARGKAKIFAVTEGLSAKTKLKVKKLRKHRKNRR